MSVYISTIINGNWERVGNNKKDTGSTKSTEKIQGSKDMVATKCSRCIIGFFVP